MHNRIYFVRAQGFFKQGQIGQVTFYEVRPWVNRSFMAFVQVVIHNDMMSCVAQLLYSHATDVACTTCHKHAHHSALSIIQLFKPRLLRPVFLSVIISFLSLCNNVPKG